MINEHGLDDKVRWVRFNTEMSESYEAINSDESLVLNVGFAGGLDPGLALGQVVLVDSISNINNGSVRKVNIQSKAWDGANKFSEKNGLASVSLLTVNDSVTNSSIKDELRAKSGAGIVDMEGSHLFELVNEKTPFISFKVVSDNADNDAWHNVKQYGERWSNILGEIVAEFIAYYLHENKQNNAGLRTLGSGL